ncbi:MAG: hypothetical protein UX19_C0002G0037 [Candidatus Woesebacteria bacterium GW2011_GWA1_45_8]|uniref:Probable membrane transporter protein n=1 Tax=Candidatus Woesebacteria bacterium GW2011_GWA1_45_8 TaxID=1618559 RepID=A0A0G1QUK1_9BACT|nr:MAG: hypothetical protein UX19_C0002G0037 [Candidatus Woesebacteria bacterium GW2011_GWA1_45_8]
MEIILLALLTFLAGILGTITGFGISTIMVPVVLLFLPLPETLLFVGVIHWFGDIWKMYFFKHGFDARLLFFFAVPGIIMAYFGARMALTLPEVLLSRFVGLILLAYVAYLFFKPDFKLKDSLLTASLGGAGSGFLGGISGVGGGALRAVVLTAFNLPKSAYIFISGLTGFVIDASRITTYFLGGTRINPDLTSGLIIFIPVSFLGAWIAKRLVNKIPQSKFRIVISIFLFLIGLKFLFFPNGG